MENGSTPKHLQLPLPISNSDIYNNDNSSAQNPSSRPGSPSQSVASASQTPRKGGKSPRTRKKKSCWKRNCTKECWQSCFINLIYFLIWCVLMMGQAYWLNWLNTEVQTLEKEFDRYLPIVEAESNRKDNLTAFVNQKQIEMNKLNATYFTIKQTVTKFNETRKEALPKIESIKTKNKDREDIVKKIKEFYEKYEPNKDIRDFITALNTNINYDKYKYNWRDPKLNYEFVQI